MRYLVMLGIVGLLLVGGGVYWYSERTLGGYLDLATPRKQNGLYLRAIELLDFGSERLMAVHIQSLSNSPARSVPEFAAYDPAGRRVDYRWISSDVSPYPNSRRVRIFLNHPPSVAFVTLEARQGGTTSRWRLRPPSPIHAVKPQETYDEWVRHPEIDIRLGAATQVAKDGSSPMTIGFRQYEVRSKPPYEWKFQIDAWIPEWLTPLPNSSSVESILAEAKRPNKKGSAVFLKPGKSNSQQVSGRQPMYTIFGDCYRVCRILGRLQKCETYEETIDLSGEPVEVRRHRYGYAYVIPLRDMEWRTPSGARVRWLRQEPRYGLAHEDGWATLCLHVDSLEIARHKSPLRKKYRLEPEVTHLFESEPRPPRGVVLGLASKPGEPFLIPVKLVRNGNRWVLPTVRVEFSHRVPLETVLFDRVVPVEAIKK
ncbi:MAG: hypothetical protein N2554_03455 [Fimbriimonadales bacterium]|nr:hypothetical protein [Fimbriimonadales bacterium]